MCIYIYRLCSNGCGKSCIDGPQWRLTSLSCQTPVQLMLCVCVACLDDDDDDDDGGDDDVDGDEWKAHSRSRCPSRRSARVAVLTMADIVN